MTDLSGAVLALVARLETAGLRACADLADLNPPAVLVRAPTVGWRFKSGDWGADWVVYAVAPESGGYLPALRILGDLLDRTRLALAGAPLGARPVTVLTTDAAELPALEMTWSDRIKSS